MVTDMTDDGYHIIGHSILDFWEAQGENNHWIARAARDIKMLVGFLDAQVAIEAQLMEAIVAQGKIDQPLVTETGDVIEDVRGPHS